MAVNLHFRQFFFSPPSQVPADYLPPDASDVEDVTIEVRDFVQVDTTYGCRYYGRVVELNTEIQWARVKTGPYSEWFSAAELTLLIKGSALEAMTAPEQPERVRAAAEAVVSAS